MRNFFTLGFLLIGITVFAQEFNFDIHNTTLKEYIQMERNLKSEQIPNIRNHISIENAQPIKFKRKQKIISDLVGYYYFKKKDSTMSYICYEWDESLLTLKANTNDKKSKKYQKALIRKFNELEKMITDIYGNPQSEGDLSDLKKANEKGGLKKNVKWFPNDSTEIEMYAIVSNFYEKRGMVTTAPTHRIRLYVNKIEQKKQKKLDVNENRIDSLNAIALNFFQAVKTQDFIKSKSYLSDLIKENVTDEQLSKLTEDIDFERDFELAYNGVQYGAKGKFTTLQYKYKDDTSTPPSELIKIIFDDENKIASVKPLKLQGKITD